MIRFFKKHLIFGASLLTFLATLIFSAFLSILGEDFIIKHFYEEMFQFVYGVNILFFPIFFVFFLLWATLNFEKDRLFSIIAVIIILFSSLFFLYAGGGKFEYKGPDEGIKYVQNVRD